eukprot:5743472-Alexandrium_andersonii.AAC.1
MTVAPAMAIAQQKHVGKTQLRRLAPRPPAKTPIPLPGTPAGAISNFSWIAARLGICTNGG